jgi:hemoglobin
MNAASYIRLLAMPLSVASLCLAWPALSQDTSPMSPQSAAPPMSMDAGNTGNAAGAEPIAGDSVYKAFHEQAGIDRIIDDFVGRVTTDPRIAERFQGANLVRLRFELKQQVCYLTGGPCTYTGKDMKSAHAGMNLQNRDFNALAEDLQLSMNKEQVSFPAQNRLLAKLAPMQRAIVSK